MNIIKTEQFVEISTTLDFSFFENRNEPIKIEFQNFDETLEANHEFRFDLNIFPTEILRKISGVHITESNLESITGVFNNTVIDLSIWDVSLKEEFSREDFLNEWGASLQKIELGRVNQIIPTHNLFLKQKIDLFHVEGAQLSFLGIFKNMKIATFGTDSQFMTKLSKSFEGKTGDEPTARIVRISTNGYDYEAFIPGLQMLKPNEIILYDFSLEDFEEDDVNVFLQSIPKECVRVYLPNSEAAYFQKINARPELIFSDA